MNVTYLFGAGASVGALPIVSQIPSRIEQIITLMEDVNYTLSEKESYRSTNFEQYSKNKYKNGILTI